MNIVRLKKINIEDKYGCTALIKGILLNFYLNLNPFLSQGIKTVTNIIEIKNK